MESYSYIINGGRRLHGEIDVQAAKNSVLALLAASVMAGGVVVLKKCPRITDVDNMLLILSSLGVKYRFEGEGLILEPQQADTHAIPVEYAKELRASVFLLGPVLARFRRAVVPYPGGCNIGTRPIDLHLEGLKALGVKIEEGGGYIFCDGKNMRGGDVRFSYPSVGATENVMMAAALAAGATTIYNAAREPEIVDLQDFINAMGGRVCGAGTDTVKIEGVKALRSAEFLPMPDRIVAGTYFLAALLTGGELTLKTNPAHIDPLLSKFSDNACKIVRFSDKIIIKADGRPRAVKLIETQPYPGFPTDLQSQVMTLAAISEGTTVIEENLFETRFRHAAELVKMGADISVDGRRATVRGVKTLSGAAVRAYDLRGGAGLVLAGLAANGETTVEDVRHIDRGYENLDGILSGLGADITRISSKL